MRRIIYAITITSVLCACSGKSGSTSKDEPTVNDSVELVTTKYATGFTVRDSADVRFVEVGNRDRFALVHSDDISVPDNFIKVRVPILYRGPTKPPRKGRLSYGVLRRAEKRI